MKQFALPLAIALGLAVVSAPVIVHAQQRQHDQKNDQKQDRKQPARSAPARNGGQAQPHPARHPPPQATRPAPQPHPAARTAPQPHPAVRVVPHTAPRRAVAPQRQAPQRQEPRRAVAPKVTPQRATAPHQTPNRAATPQRQAPSVNRATQRRQPTANHREERARQRTQPANKTTPQPSTRRAQPTIKAAPTSPSTETRRAEPNHRAREQREQPANRRNAAQPTTTARPRTATPRQTRAQRRALRRQRTAPVTAPAARRGRFAAPFAAAARTAPAVRARKQHYAARRAWRRGLRAAFVAWYGPVFWPYAYSDIFDYTFWDYGYEDGYWAYAYDDFIDSLFWGEAGPPAEYVEYDVAPPPRPRYAAVEELCKQPGTGITAWPFTEIERRLSLDHAQRALLGEVRAAARRAASVFKNSCPSDKAFPLTPPGRLRAMRARLRATLEAVETVRPALERFYDSLSDEQKERFNELGPVKLRNNNAEARNALPQDAKTCAEAKPGLTNLPIEQIDAVVAPDERQERLLDDLEDATKQAVSILQAACPEETPLTPPGRLAAMQARLKAMVDAADTVKPALDAFYASLSNEQKARFNRIGQILAQADK